MSEQRVWIPDDGKMKGGKHLAAGKETAKYMNDLETRLNAALEASSIAETARLNALGLLREAEAALRPLAVLDLVRKNDRPDEEPFWAVNSTALTLGDHRHAANLIDRIREVLK